MNARKTLNFVILISATLGAGWLLADDDDDDDHRRGYGGHYSQLAPIPQSAAHTKWRVECASCHMLYHPGLLPERSWKKMMGELDKHFGENAGLDAKARDEISRFLASNAADRVDSRRSAKIARSISQRDAPLRISETAYFIHKHDEIRGEVWKRKKVGGAANCIACHPGAEKGNFSEEEIRIPR